jgi:hypothetical protein
MMTGRSCRKLGHNLIQQALRSLQTAIATACAGCSVEHGLSAAGGVFGFYEHCSAADKPKSLGHRIMSLLAELLVEEWLNRDGYFTIHGARFGVSEMDLLAIRQVESGLEARHIEVQVSINPIAYISPFTDAQAKTLGKSRTSACARPRDVLDVAVSAWIDKKFHSPGKVKARNRAWSGLLWSLEFVHGSVRHPEELTLIRDKGIKLHTFYSVLASLCNDEVVAHKGGAGTDIAEMLAYYVKNREPA